MKRSRPSYVQSVWFRGGWGVASRTARVLWAFALFVWVIAVSVGAQQATVDIQTLNMKVAEAEAVPSPRQEVINRIIASFRQRQVTKAQAEKALYVMIKQDVHAELQAADQEMAALEKRIEELKQLKQDPDAEVRRRIDSLLYAGPQAKDVTQRKRP